LTILYDSLLADKIIVEVPDHAFHLINEANNNTRAFKGMYVKLAYFIDGSMSDSLHLDPGC
jgi:hypothetical protein